MSKADTGDRSTQGLPTDTPTRRVERTLSREAYALLAQANLLRMRGEWPEATEKCMAALRLSPDNPSAQSLLGDIYENQGRLDDAIQWYRMALDVQPDSPADQIKLARLLNQKARDLVPQTTGSDSGEGGPGLSVLPSLPLRWRSDPDRLLRRFAFVAGTLAVLVVCLALVLAHRTGALGLGATPRRVDAPPVVVPSLTALPISVSPSPPPPADADPSEIALLSALQASPLSKNEGVSVTSVTLDPRTERLTVTLLCRTPSDAPQSRDLILWASTGVLQAAVQEAAAAPVTQFTVRCLLTTQAGGAAPLVFTADATRPAISALPADLGAATTAQVSAAYTNPWWASSLSQQR